MSKLDTVKALFNTRMMDLIGLGYVVKFDFGDDGHLIIDGTLPMPVIVRDSDSVACTIKLTIDNAKNLASGSLNPTLAYMSGKLKIEGSTGVAMKLSTMLED